MSRQVYRQLCADPRRFDFGCLPLLLPAPRQGRSWTIRWQQPDRALVVSGERLLHLQSDSGPERREVSAPAPGRLCVLVPDSRFVAHFQPVGTLEYGVRFAPPPAPTGEAQELERQLDVLRQAEVRQARRQQAEERQQREGEGRLRELSRQVATAEAAAAASQQSHAAAIAAVPELRQALLNRILTLLSERPSARVPFPALWQGLLLLTQLSAAPPAGEAPPSAAAPTDGLIARFFQWLLPQVTASSPPLPAVLQRHRQECWEEIAEAFLPAPSSSAEHMIPESRR